MKKTSKKAIIPDLAEYTDEEGKKWIQTSTDDLFSIKELNEILESIDKGGDSDEIILARIDFQKVNKEYYETAIRLQKKLKQQTELLKKVVTDARTTIERKNKKLRELIDYIKKLHTLLAHLSASEDDLQKLKVSPEMLVRSLGTAFTDREETEESFEQVEEIVLPLEAKINKIK
ncbi:MAG TPA: hypothetical protein PK307_15640 [Spirochaetota bacterium]|nr:hypothetical protein [Spirochaetota bacterium]HOD16885.1 hypothetical protein [Spirochaetota bacterium]HPG51166.1 hypothetical protein [Spirochaetota bacterium]HPN13568.1 hypothetical protein [Spirochaetota bacterium]HQL83634.1 hypothetical protein [Spirochaetota bacterium]